jgi:predicted PurR-regulated permease PerM
MEQGISVNFVMSILLAITGVMLMRVMSGIDKNTDAVSELTGTVRELGLLLSSQGDRIRKIEERHEEIFNKMEGQVGAVRSRQHEFANTLTALILTVQTIGRKVDVPTHLGQDVTKQ